MMDSFNEKSCMNCIQWMGRNSLSKCKLTGDWCRWQDGCNKHEPMGKKKIEFKRENKYIVVKIDDLKYLTDREKTELEVILGLIQVNRLTNGKKPNSYVVVNESEPYAEQVWKLIQEEWEKEVNK